MSSDKWPDSVTDQLKKKFKQSTASEIIMKKVSDNNVDIDIISRESSNPFEVEEPKTENVS